MIQLRYTLFVLLIVYTCSANAQGVLNNNSISVKWKQINTPDFRVIFPADFEQEAQEVANTLQTIHEPEKMGEKAPRKISIVLRNEHAVSNGFVTLGPRRSEFYTMPPQDYNFLGTNKWLQLLAVHEYRHIAQYEQSRTGWNKFFYYLFGQNTQAGMAAVAGPPWFWEGDAVATESINTHSGRGRIPAFSRVFKTNLMEGKRFNYHKQHLRSFKDFVPDHYKLGYHMVAHLRRRTEDPSIMDKVAKGAFSWPFIPFTFSNSLKRQTGLYLVQNYELMMDDMQQQWEAQLKDLKPSSFAAITNRKTSDFTEYSYPQPLPDGTFVVYKTGIGDVGQLVRIDAEGEEIERHITGIMNNTGMLSSTQYKVVWNEYFVHPRWRAKTYSVIKSYDFATGVEQTITKKSRYSGAAISPDGYKIATTLTTTEGENFVVILDTYTGKELSRFPNPDNAFYAMPRWSGDGNTIVLLKTTDKGKALIEFDTDSEEEKVLIPSSHENIGYPVPYDNYVLYNSPYNGIDNIYALDRADGSRYQVTKSKYGAYNPAVSNDGSSFIYNEHTVSGLDVVKADFDPQQWVPLGEVADRNVDYFQPLVEQNGHEDILSTVPDKKYEVKNYSELGHMINLHSWGPYATTDITKAQIGLFSRDVLSTTDINLGYTYDVNEETGFASAGLSYQGLYPIIDFEIQTGNRSSDEGTINGEEVKFEWHETGVEAGLRVPFDFTRSKYYTELEIGNSIGYRSISDFKNSVLEGSRLAPINDSLAFFFRDAVNGGDLIFNKSMLSFFRLMKQSTRDINSRFGQSASLELYNTPYNGDYQGRLFAARANLYFPSPLQLINKNLGKHHSLYFRFGYQSRLAELSGDLYYFRNRIPKPRGYSYPEHEKFTSFSINYMLPLWYPDVALGPILNFKRVRLNGFLDVARGTGKNYFIEYRESEPRAFFSTLDEDYRSIGAELLVDFNVMRFRPLITLGARYSYLTTTSETNIDFLVVNIAF